MKIKCRHRPLWLYARKEVKKIDFDAEIKKMHREVYIGTISCSECHVFWRLYVNIPYNKILIRDPNDEKIIDVIAL